MVIKEMRLITGTDENMNYRKKKTGKEEIY
jgi:hypothetical protein